MARASLLINSKRLLRGGRIVQIRVWAVPTAVRGSSHRLKYSLFFGGPGERLVIYDNEAGKGDHRHLMEVEEPYDFRGLRRLLDDFEADVQQILERES